MKFNRIISLLLILVLLISMLPAVYAAEITDEAVPTDEPTEPGYTATGSDAEPADSEPDDTGSTLNPALAESGFTSDQVQQSYVTLEDPGEYAISTFSVKKTATLRNCDQMDIILSDNTRQGFHYADEDGKAPWDYMNMIYCLENKKTFSVGSGHEGVGDLPIDGSGTTQGEKVWYSLSSDQRVAIGLILLYGAPTKLWDEEWGINPDGNRLVHNPNIGYRFATQALIWEIASGMRDATPPYKLNNTYWYDRAVGQCTSEDGTVDHFLVAYESILNDMRMHNVIPSFTGDFASTAPVIEMTGNSISLTDSNGVLARFDFTNTNGVSYSKNGNTLTITASGTVPTGVQSAVATLPSPQSSLYEVWYNQYDSSKQTCIKVSVPASDPVPAYFKLKASIGSLSLQKTTEDGNNLAGWQFGIYSDSACTKLISGPYTTDANGKISVIGLASGDVWVKEISHQDAAINALYKCTSTNPQKVTIVAGQAAKVSFNNDLRTGECKIIKAATNDGSVAGWHFTVKDASGTVIGNYVTDSTGVITLGLKPGTYTVTETDGAEKYWVNDPNPTKTVTVKADETVEVTFNNQWIGQAQIIKTLENPEVGSLEGWTFTIHKVTENGGAIRADYVATVTTGSDGTILQDLEPGDYLITEQLEEDSLWQCVTDKSQIVTVQAGQTAEVTFTNALRPGEIRIQKVDTNGEPLEGVVFLLEWSEDGISWQSVTYTDSSIPQIGGCTTQGLTDGNLVTDEDGFAVFSGLYPTLQYRLTETATKDGYQLLADYAFVGELPVEDLSVSLRVVNTPIFALPQTGSQSLALMPVALVLCLGACISALLYLRKKEI